MASISCDQVPGMSLRAYLTRIEWPHSLDLPVPQTFETLELLQRCHSTAIPFDNFDYHIAGGLLLKPHEKWSQISMKRRGTTCFQGNFLFAHALRLIGFEASLLPVSTWRSVALSFSLLPLHSAVIIRLHEKWYFTDVASVDCLDGILEISLPPGTIQTSRNGVRFKFVAINNHSYEVSEKLRSKLEESGDLFYQNYLLTMQDYFTIALVKEDILRDSTFNPIEPIEYQWINRFSIRFPKINIRDSIRPEDNLLCTFNHLPPSCSWDICDLITQFSALRDPAAHHYKQWVGIKYSSDGRSKHIVSGFRYIVTLRPFSARQVTYCAAEGGNMGIDSKVSDDTILSAFDRVRIHLESVIGIFLTPEEIASLNLRHNYCLPKVEHVWAY